MGIDLTNYKPRNPERTVYVKGVDARVTKPVLMELMRQPAPVLNLYYPREPHQGFCFVEYATSEQAEYAVNILEGIKLYDKLLQMSVLEVNGYQATLYVGNIGKEIREAELNIIFSKFGKVECQVARNRNGVSKGFGFVRFTKEEECDRAIQHTNGKKVFGRVLYVNRKRECSNLVSP
ncbi:Splicing factor 3B subunit 4 [Astathelohania contejeani]|uniref:Splicing factor 3B subunit 4 n=1 Tax=Astathelohania contejeani TaxID=164912 RepID=A0ABQ7I018_9MICR|nr:Splicing factor 3B subunit 4 [Thelohania contejeani]